MIVCLFFKKKVLKIEEFVPQATGTGYPGLMTVICSSQLSAINANEFYFLKEI